ncbi:hypothetical protein PAXRUDRAFT_774698, partial [Paxillus rubicundulus Ve08.2h10]
MDDQVCQSHKKMDHTMVEAFGKCWGNHLLFKVGTIMDCSRGFLEQSPDTLNPNFVFLLPHKASSHGSYDGEGTGSINPLIKGLFLGKFPIDLQTDSLSGVWCWVVNKKVPALGKVEGDELADGTYATETAYTSLAPVCSEASKAKPLLRVLVLGGDFFTVTVLAAALTKFVLGYDEQTSDWTCANVLCAEAMLMMTSAIWVSQSKFDTAAIDEDSNKHILSCIQTLSELHAHAEVNGMFLRDTQAVYSKRLGSQEKHVAEKNKVEGTKETIVQVNNLLNFRQFSKKSTDDPINYADGLGKAAGAREVHKDFISNLSKISQLTDVLLVNQTPNTLQSLCLDFTTLGDLKLVECPAMYTITPHGFQSIKATIKMSSTETGVIFRSILWEGPGLAESCMILNNIHINIMDYIEPAYCSETQVFGTPDDFDLALIVPEHVKTITASPGDIWSIASLSAIVKWWQIAGNLELLTPTIASFPIWNGKRVNK